MNIDWSKKITAAQKEADALQSKRESAVVSAFQAKAALKQFGKLQAVKDYIATLPEDDTARLAWENAQVFKRLSPTVAALAAELQLTDEKLDVLFETAKGIEA